MYYKHRLTTSKSNNYKYWKGNSRSSSTFLSIIGILVIIVSYKTLLKLIVKVEKYCQLTTWIKISVWCSNKVVDKIKELPCTFTRTQKLKGLDLKWVHRTDCVFWLLLWFLDCRIERLCKIMSKLLCGIVVLLSICACYNVKNEEQNPTTLCTCSIMFPNPIWDFH